MRLICLCLLTLTIGCNTQEVVQLPSPVTQGDLVSTLEQVANTGQYEDDVLTALTMGLEEAGMMDEAAHIQQWPAIDNQAKVKQLAKQVASRVTKRLASSNH